jgi:peptide deformylase
VSEITKEIQLLALDMLETMYVAPGVGLAAPQIGKNIRMVVTDWSEDKTLPMVWVNPVLTPVGKQLVCGMEGCLSVPGREGMVNRYLKLKVSAMTLDGKKINLTLDEFPARVLQHEVDHLDGILYTDKIVDNQLFKIDPLNHKRKSKKDI